MGGATIVAGNTALRELKPNRRKGNITIRSRTRIFSRIPPMTTPATMRRYGTCTMSWTAGGFHSFIIDSASRDSRKSSTIIQVPMPWAVTSVAAAATMPIMKSRRSFVLNASRMTRPRPRIQEPCTADHTQRMGTTVHVSSGRYWRATTSIARNRYEKMTGRGCRKGPRSQTARTITRLVTITDRTLR